MSSKEDSLRIELRSCYIERSSFDVFTNETRKNDIKHLTIVQKDYYGYNIPLDNSCSVTIPDTISTLSELESITIRPCIETLPNTLCQLTKLEILDLSECYNILSIPPEVLTMPNLKIKIGEIITPGSCYYQNSKARNILRHIRCSVR